MTIDVSKIPDAWSVGTTVSNAFGLAAANPYIAGFQAISSIFGGGTKIKQSGTSGEAYSGQANFNGQNNVTSKPNIIDFSNKIHVAALASGLVLAIWLYKKGYLKNGFNFR